MGSIVLLEPADVRLLVPLRGLLARVPHACDAALAAFALPRWCLYCWFARPCASGGGPRRAIAARDKYNETIAKTYHDPFGAQRHFCPQIRIVCRSIQKVDKRGGTDQGPSLLDVGKKLSADALSRQIHDRRWTMPAFGGALTTPEIHS